jgi:peptidoglycan/LPS O-acetylase OafA/YrhL
VAQILEPLRALGAGFLAAALVLALAALLIRWLAPQMLPKPQEPVILLANAATSLLAGLAGGYVTAAVADARPLEHALALALIVLLLAALAAIETRGRFPLLYQTAVVAATPLAVLAGAILRLRLAGLA